MRHAILDLGTNTFNLLIVETGCCENHKVILSRKEPVKLGEGGITEGRISDEAFSRGIAAVENHLKYITNHRAEVVHAYATSAIRSASNGLEFVTTIYRKFNIGIQIISGDREADLIYLGVKQAVDMGDRKHLILDIGGGSNELIIADSNTIYWKKSYPLGMARMLEKFKPSDPITTEEVIALENHFSSSMNCFLEAAAKHNPEILIGSSGSFDTFRALLIPSTGKTVTKDTVNVSLPDRTMNGISTEQRGDNKPGLQGEELLSPFYKIDPVDFGKLHERLLKSDALERMSMEGMDPMRVEMIVIAAIFVNFIIRKLDIKQLIQSDYALKEGAVNEILDHQILQA